MKLIDLNSSAAAGDTVNNAPALTGSQAILPNGVEDMGFIVSAETLLTGFSDDDNDPLSVIDVTADHGDVVDHGDGTWTITPWADYNGPMVLSYGVTDGTDSVAATLGYIVDAANEVPTGSPTALISPGLEDTQQFIAAGILLAGFSDIDGDELSVSAIDVTNGALTAVTGGWIFTPVANYNGQVTLTYTVSDGHGGDIVQVRVFTIDPVNDAPVLTTPAVLADLGNRSTYVLHLSDLLAGFSDVEGEALSIIGLGVGHATLVDNGDDTWTVTPAAGFTGVLTYSYVVTDGTNPVAATLSQTVVNGNIAPALTGTRAVLDDATEDTGYVIALADLLAGFSDGNGDALSVTGLTADHGDVVENSDGSWTLTQEADYNGVVVISYTVSDGDDGGTVAASLNLTVAPANDAPTGSGTGTISDGLEDTPQIILAANLLAGFSDIDGDTLVISAIDAAHGTLTATTGGWIFTPESNYNGVVKVTYTVSDGHGGDIDQIRTFTLVAVNDAPVHTAPAVLADLGNRSTFVLHLSDLLTGFGDVEGDALTVSRVTADHASLVDNGDDTWTVTPVAGFTGVLTYAYTVSDGANQVPATLEQTVVDGNRAPALTGLQATLVDAVEDTDYVIALADLLAGFSDLDSDSLSVTGLTSDHGDVVENPDGSWTLSQEADYNGPVVLSYTVADSHGGSLAASLDLNVAAVNDAPTGAPTGTVPDGFEDVPQTILAADLLAGFSDIDGDSRVISAIDVTNGALIATTGGWIFTPDANYNGTVTVTYTVSDGHGETLPGVTRTFELAAVNDAPALDTPAVLADFGNRSTYVLHLGDLLAGFSDVEGEALSISGLTADHADLVDNGDDSWTVTAVRGFSGTLTYSYTVSDGTNPVAAKLSQTVTEDNTGPALTGLQAVLSDAVEDTAYTIRKADLLAGFSDSDGDDLAVSELTTDHGVLVDHHDGTWTLTQEADYNGPVVIGYKVIDGYGGSLAATLGLTVTAVNDAPRGTPTGTIADGTEDTQQIILAADLLAGFRDVEHDDLSVSAITVDHGSLVVTTGGWTFTPDADYFGQVTVTYTVSDGQGGTLAGQTRSFTLSGTPDAPLAPDGTVQLNEDQVLTDYPLTASDPDFDTLTYILVTGPAHGSVEIDARGSFSYTPDADYYGADSFVYRVNDGTTNSRDATITLNIKPVNDAPRGAPTGTIADGTEDTRQTILASDLLAGFSDVDSTTLSVSAISADHGSLTAISGGWIFRPSVDYNGRVTLTYTVSDGYGGTLAGQTRSFDLAAVGDLPRGATTNLPSGTEDVTYSVTGTALLSGLFDGDGDPISLQNVSATYSTGYVGGDVMTFAKLQGGFLLIDSVALAGGGSVMSYRDYNNGYQYVIQVIAADGTQANKLYVGDDYTLVALNDGSFVAMAASQVNGSTTNVYATHYSATGAIIDARVTLSSSTNGYYKSGMNAVALDSGGYLATWVETPAAGGTGATYVRKFNADGSADGAASSVGTPGVAVFLSAYHDGSFVVTWQEFGHAGGNRNDILAQRYDADGVAKGEAFFVNSALAGEQNGPSVSTLAGGGFVVTWRDDRYTEFRVYDANGNAIGSEHSISNTYNAIANFYTNQYRPEVVGLADGGFVISTGYLDGSGNGIALIRFDASGNQLGVVTNVPADVFGDQYSSHLSLRADGSLLAVWDYGASVQQRIFTEGVQGTATMTYDAATDTYSFTRPLDSNGLLTIHYDVTDGVDGTISTSTTVNINAVNDAPVGASTTVLAAIDEDTSFTVTRAQLLAGYSDVDSATLSVRNNTVTTTSGTAIYNSSNGTWTIAPAANYNGTVTLTYTVTDGAANAATGGSLTFTVNPVPDAPLLTGAKATVNGTEDFSVTLTTAQLKQGYSDADGDPLTISDISVNRGTLVDNGNGTWTLSLPANAYGAVAVSYTLNDGTGLSLATSLTVNFASVNDIPTGSPTGTVADGTEDTPQTILAADLLAGFSDVETALSVSAISVNHGTLTATTGGWIFTPALNYNGAVTVTYTVSDGEGGNLTGRTRSFNLAAVNDAPALTGAKASISTNEDIAFTVTRAQLLQGYSDVENDTMTVSGLSVTHATLVDNGNNTWTVTPDANYYGTVTLSYTISDGNDGTLATSLNVAVASVNDIPTGSPTGTIADGTEDTTQVILAADLLAGFTDVETALSVSAISVNHGTLTATTGGWTFTPAANYYGAVTVTYTVSDGQGGTITGQTRSFNLASVNDIPTGSPTGTITNGTEDTSQVILSSTLLAAFSDVETALSVSAISVNHGTLTATTGGWTFTPDANYYGAVTVTYTVSDGEGGTLTGQTRSFSLASVNDIPTGSPTGTIADGTEDTPQTILSSTLLAGFTDVETALSVSAISVDHGTLTTTAGGWTFTPAANYYGTVTVTYTVSDGQGGTLTGQTRSFELASVNDLPTLTSTKASVSSNEDTAVTVSLAQLRQGYSDADGDAMAITNLSVTHATFVDNGNNTWTITPDANYYGTVKLSYTLDDGLGGTLPTSLDITIVSVNDVPTGSPTGTIADGIEDTTQVILAADLLAGFTDVETALSVSAISVNHGTLVATTGGWTFTPAANYYGTVTVTYTVSDGQGGTITGQTRSFELASVNDLPTLTSTKASVSSNEDTAVTVTLAQLRQGYSDADGDAMAITNLSVTHATFVDNGNNTWTITPDANYYGTVKLSYTLDDGLGGTLPTSLDITIVSVNDVPTGSPTGTIADGTEDTNQVILAADLLAGFTDVETALSVSAISVNHGTLTATTGGWTFTPAANYYGAVTVTYTVSDGQGGTITGQTRSFELASVNDAPIGAPTGTVANGSEDTTQVILAADLLAGFSDIDGGTLSVSAIAASHGSLTATTSGWTFTPDADYYGAVTVTYTVSDGQGGSLTGQTRSFTLASVNDAPKGSPTGTVANGTEDTTQVILAADLLAGFSDIDGGTLSVSAIAADHGSLVATTGGWTFTPAANYNGTVIVTYTVSDGQGGTLTGQTRSFTLAAVNDAPSLTGTPATLVSGSEDIAYAISAADLLAGYSDRDHDLMSVTGLSATHGRITDNGGGSYTFTPDTDYFGSVTLSYTVSDGHGGSLPATAAFVLTRVIDTVTSNTTTVLAAGLDNLTLTGSDNINATGNALSNVLRGNGGNNRLDGSTGADTMYGDAGNDTYYVDNTGDVVSEQIVAGTDDGGADRIYASVSYTMAAGVEIMSLTGSDNLDAFGNAENNTLYGNAGNNHLYGLAGNDNLSGSAGADTLYGGAGNDSYVVDNIGDVVSEQTVSGVDDTGTDTVFSSISYTLGKFIEVLDLSGTANIDGTGNSAANRLIGNDGVNTLRGMQGNDSLDGGLGADIMYGGVGNDTYVVDQIGDLVSEQTVSGTDDGGTDKIFSAISYVLPQYVEILSLTGTADNTATGNSGDDILIGNSGKNHLYGLDGNDNLTGGAGADTMFGGKGNDTYYVDNKLDVVCEQTVSGTDDGGTDRIYASVTYTMGTGIEIMSLTGTGNINGMGNAGNNTLYGNAGDNHLYGYAGNDNLSGSSGNDTMYGGAGNDSYVVDSIGDVVSEQTVNGTDDGGTDKVYSSVSFTLAQYVENLSLSGTANINGTGNAANNTLTGNDGDNVLSGLQGTDYLAGGAGADIFMFEHIGAAWGTDRITDFVSGVDHLGFTAADFGFSAGHQLTAAQLSLTGASVGSGAQFVYNATSRTLYWDANGSASGGLTAIVVLNAGATLATSDFLFS